MIREKLGLLGLSGLSLSTQIVATAQDFVAESQNELRQESAKNKQVMEYAADLQERLMVEGAWLKIPGACKDRSISSEPRVIGVEQASESLKLIHALLGEV